jgi:transcription-repair coupling factor (superfamily II helicase)
LDSIKNEEQLQKISEELKDRFGPIPTPVEELINTVRLRWLGEKLGFEKLSLKNERLRAYFISNNDKYFSSDVFGNILAYIQQHQRQCKIKDQGGKAMMVVEQVDHVDKAIQLLNHMHVFEFKSSKEISSK